ncbi:protein MEMO1-like [Lytechinus pictus]|uniref:protein MEMO1-like n=1 Tax=Lytechinus pictus TaxID=7653 RepID=UPI0030BA1163
MCLEDSLGVLRRECGSNFLGGGNDFSSGFILGKTVKTLSGELDGWLSKADQCSRARAIIAPHAGYSYSGACGAYAYKQVDPTNIERVFILGPSHHVYLPGCALSTCTKYETPLYNLQVDQTVNRELMKTKMFETMSVQVDEDEHSIEMHLPYIAKVMERRRGNFTIVPVLVGALDGKKEQEYGHFFSSYLADPSNLFVVSSDFCHWGEFLFNFNSIHFILLICKKSSSGNYLRT